MRSIAISEFKATCLAVLEEVRRTGEPVLVTRRGKAVAEIVPAARPAAERRVLGVLSDRLRVLGDIVEPAVEANEWYALS